MKLIRPLGILVGLLLIVAVAALWWNRPTKADMADYVPADSLVYIEINSIPDIANAIQNSDAWKAASPVIGLANHSDNPSNLFASRLGLGPIQAVLASRAQIALVIVGVSTSEKEDLLRVKPEVALVVETHTAKWRMKSAVTDDIRRLADFAYGTSVCIERSNGIDYVECTDAKGDRKIIGAIDSSVVIIGNSEKAVENCLAVRHGQRPSLHSDAEMLRLRASLRSNSSLSFGYVSQTNAAKLVSLAGPMLIGKAPGDSQLERLLSDSAGKILRGVAWTTGPQAGLIEDHYQISLDSNVIRQLEPAFQNSDLNENYWKLIPNSFRSVTIYGSNSPQAAWSSLNSAVAIKLDAVSSVIFSSLLKSGLSGYGIEDPHNLIGALGTPVITLRPTLGEGSLLLAPVRDEEVLRRELSNALLRDGKGQILNGIQSEPVREKEFTALVINGFVILGKTENVLVYLAQLKNDEVITPERLETLRRLTRKNSAVTTYTNDRNSLLGTIAALSRFGGRTLTDDELTSLTDRFAKVEVSCTESTLNSNGIERRTLSAFGQFGSLISFAQADSATSPTR
jgi:hypothetical protein